MPTTRIGSAVSKYHKIVTLVVAVCALCVFVGQYFVNQDHLKTNDEYIKTHETVINDHTNTLTKLNMSKELQDQFNTQVRTHLALPVFAKEDIRMLIQNEQSPLLLAITKIQVNQENTSKQLDTIMKEIQDLNKTKMGGAAMLNEPNSLTSRTH